MKKKESHDQIKNIEATLKLKKEIALLKHELGITNLKMSMMEDENKIQSNLRFENLDLKSKHIKMTFELESMKLQYTKLEKYNIVVKGELTKTKKHLEKLYLGTKNLDENIMAQICVGDEIGIEYVKGESSKRSKVIEEQDLVNQ